MAKKFIFVNNDGDYQEGEQAYEQSDFIDTSAGAGDAGKPVKLNSSGLIDSSMLNVSEDHGDLTGLADDDHLQYMHIDGAGAANARAMSGALDMGSNLINNVSDGLVASDAVNKGQLDTSISGVESTIQGYEWQESVLSIETDSSGLSPSSGDRYLIKAPAPSAQDKTLTLQGNLGSEPWHNGVFTISTLEGRLDGGVSVSDPITTSSSAHAVYKLSDGGSGFYVLAENSGGTGMFMFHTDVDPDSISAGSNLGTSQTARDQVGIPFSGSIVNISNTAMLDAPSVADFGGDIVGFSYSKIDLVVTGMTNTNYNQTYTQLDNQMRLSFTDIVQVNSSGDNAFVYDAGGTWYVAIYDGQSAFAYVIVESTTDPATWTNNQSIAGLLSGSETLCPAFVNGIMGADENSLDPVISPDLADPNVSYSDPLIGASAQGDFSGQENKIAEYNGSSYDFTSPSEGMYVAVDDEGDRLYLYTSSEWTAKYFEATTASTGLTKSTFDIQMADVGGAAVDNASGVNSIAVDGSSIEITTDVLNIVDLGITDAMLAGSIADGKLAQDYIQSTEVDGVSIEFVGNTLNVMADGVSDAMIDFGLAAGQVSAADIPVEDAGLNFAATDQEGVNNELYVLLESGTNETATAGTGGVTAGDLVYFSANDTVLPMPINALHRCVGMALETATAGNPVKFVKMDSSIDGVLGGATVGDRYYWNGSSLSSTMPAGSGEYVWKVGVARSVTDLSIDIEFIKQNA